MSARSLLRRLLAAVTLGLLTATGALAQARIDPQLLGVFSGLPVGAQTEVVVTFHGNQGPAAADVEALQGAGIAGGLTFRSLPMAGVLATLDQVDRLAQSPRVRSIFWNRELEYHNYDARHMTGVERLRADAEIVRLNGNRPVTGRGVGVVINDSGVDGTHPDLQLGKNLVQNVWAPIARENLATAGFNTFVAMENQPNTDVGGTGHGTHVAGTVGGTGAASNGRNAGVAPGARLVGVGSGAAVLILNSLAGFDYAITNQAIYNIRVVTNSWGTSGSFDPDDPINVATRILTRDRNIVVLFSAGNRGGIETHSPYGAAPWAISVANGLKNGTLALTSSRGARGDGRKVAVSQTGERISYIDHPTLTAPGTSIVSAKATGTTPVNSSYSTKSGTSMSTPHVAGIVALMLEVNPLLTPAEVQQILQETATKMPGYEGFEVGAGFANAYAAVQKALDLKTPFGSTLQVPRIVAGERRELALDREFDFSPASLPGTYRYPIEVRSGASSLEVVLTYNGLEVPLYGNADNPFTLDLTDPRGNRYSAFQLYFALFNMKKLALVMPSPMPGTWYAEVKGLSTSGVETANAGAFPDRVRLSGTVLMLDAPPLADVAATHPAKGAIDFALTRGFLGLCGTGTFCPAGNINRADLARSFTQFGAVRQHLPLGGGSTFSDVAAADRPFAEAVAAHGAALRDREFRYGGVMEGNGGSFNPAGAVTRAEIARMLVRGVGGEATALAHGSKDVTVILDGKTYTVADQAEIPVALRGHAHVAINSNMLNVHWVLEQGPYDLTPVLKPYFRPTDAMSRADAAVAIARYFNQYFFP